MSEKKKEDRLFDYEQEIHQLRDLTNLFLGLFEGSLREWEESIPNDDDTQKKMARRLTNTRFNALDTINDLIKTIQGDLGKVPRNTR